MKSNLLKTLLIAGLAGCGALGAQAQTAPAPKIAVVDLATVFAKYWQSIDQGIRVDNERNAARAELQAISAQSAELVQKYNTQITDASKNVVAMNDDAKAKVNQALTDLRAAIDAKQRDFQKVQEDRGNTIQSELNAFKALTLKDITAVATRICKQHGDNILLDISPNTAYGTTTILYVDPGYTDITADVLADLNKDHPAAAAPAMPAAPTK